MTLVYCNVNKQIILKSTAFAELDVEVEFAALYLPLVVKQKKTILSFNLKLITLKGS
jgi:hypothetical protein